MPNYSISDDVNILDGKGIYQSSSGAAGIVPGEVSDILDNLNITFSNQGIYLQVGELTVSQGWILYLSVVYTGFEKLLTTILPILTIPSLNLTFRIIKDLETLQQLNRGYYGDQNIGKAVTIFIQDDRMVDALVGALLPLVETFAGPQIGTALRVR